MRSFRLRIICTAVFLSMVLMTGTQLYSEDKPPTKDASPSKGKGEDYQIIRSTNFNFEEAMIDGKMKSPNGFLLEGRQRTSQQNMIQLRTDFNQELQDSKAAIMAIPAH